MSKKQTYNKDVTPTSSRSKNFSTKEDVMLSRAYVNTSQDPIKGNDQKSGMLWKNVTIAFMELSEKAGLDVDDMGRGELALYNRFKRHISKDVQLYCGYHLRVQANNQSGVSEEDVVKEAMAMFLEEEEKAARCFARRVVLLLLREEVLCRRCWGRTETESGAIFPSSSSRRRR